MNGLRSVLLVQLPIPPTGPEPIEGNVPLAAAYLKLFAQRQGLEKSYAIELFPAQSANNLGDQGLVEAILNQQPWMVGFSCYLWNVERTLWIAERLKQRRPELLVLLGGPEITADNVWVLQNPAVDYAVLGEGEQPFARLLAALAKEDKKDVADKNVCPTVFDIPNVHVGKSVAPTDRARTAAEGPHPSPLPKGEGTAIDLDAISSPYVAGILDLADGQRMSLETARGCRFGCKYCYYPKSHEGLRFLSDDQILANLNFAVEHGAKEVVLLDPTLNQRPDFAGFLRLLRRGNAEGRLAFSGELRAEGIDAELARLLREANFHEVEIGLQSVEPLAWKLMGRPVNLKAFERGVKAIMAEGIKARVDLILGLPGDTVDSVRRGIDFLCDTRTYSEAQVFSLSILPGTAFRREAEQLGLKFQPWPPYYVLQTPTLDVEDMLDLMEEAQEAFGVEFDALPPPQLDLLDERSVCRIDLDAGKGDGGRTDEPLPIATELLAVLPPSPSSAFPARAFTFWFRSADFAQHQQEMAQHIRRLLTDNPHTTLQVVLEPTGDPERLTVETLETLMAACYRTTTYLDRYYSLQPGRLLGSKRLVVLLPGDSQTSDLWQEDVSEFATLVFRD